MVVTRVPPARAGGAGPDQEIRFCRGASGVRIAYAVHGSGPPLVIVSCWLSHLRYDWQSPVWRHFLDDLGALATVVRYDERGFGLSDWTIDDFSLDARLGDLEGVVEAVGLDRFAVLGMSGGSTVAMAYAARHPERGPGRRHPPAEGAQCLGFSRITNSLASRGCRMTARSRVFAVLLGFRETEWSAMVGS